MPRDPPTPMQWSKRSAPLTSALTNSPRNSPKASRVTDAAAVKRKARILNFIGPDGSLSRSLPPSDSRPAIGVQAGEDQVHPQVAEDRGQEADDRQDRRATAVPSPRDPGVKERRVHEPHDEGPRLLGVPGPVGAPGVVRPGRPRDDPGGQKRESPDDRPVNQLVQDLRRGEQANHTAGHLPLLLLRLHEEQARPPGGDGESRGPHEAGDDVGVEPVRLQGGDQRLDAALVREGEQHGAEGDRDHEGPEGPAPVFPPPCQGGEVDRPGEEDERLVEVGHGNAADPHLVRLGPPDADCGGRHDGGGDANPGPDAGKDHFLPVQGGYVVDGCDAEKQCGDIKQADVQHGEVSPGCLYDTVRGQAPTAFISACIFSNLFSKASLFLFVEPARTTSTRPSPPRESRIQSRWWDMKKAIMIPMTMSVQPTHTMFTPGSWATWSPV